MNTFPSAIQFPSKSLGAKSDIYHTQRYRHPDTGEWIIVTYTGHHIRASTLVERYLKTQENLQWERDRKNNPLYRKYYWR
jgi:hypothetical protein